MAQRFPYFPFYADDFYSDPLVQVMTLEQEAIYIRLLWAGWKQDEAGTLPCDDALICKIANIKRSTWFKNKEAVLKPFDFGIDGRWHQKRLKTEYAKAAVRSDVARKNAEARWIKHRSNGESDAAALLAQHCGGNAIASGSSSLSLERKGEEKGMQGEGENHAENLSLPRRPDPNTFVPSRTAKPTYIDRKNPPFPPTEFWNHQTLKLAMVGYLDHVAEGKPGQWEPWELTHRQFACLVFDMEREFRSWKAAENALIRTVRKGLKHVLLPSETGEQHKR